jgi:hypothetical protein
MIDSPVDPVSSSSPVPRKAYPLSVAMILTALALILSSSCYIYGYLKPVKDVRYTGIRPLNASDFNANAAWIHQIREGKFLLTNLYTPGTHRGVLFRPMYLVSTLPFSFLPISSVTTLHLLRFVWGALLLLSLFRWISVFNGSSRKAITLTFVFLLFSSGVGFFIKRWIPHPVDFSVPEAILFLTLGEPPHFQFSLFLLWLGLTCFYQATTDRKGRLFVYCSVLLLLSFEHPFEGVILGATGVCNIWLLPSFTKRLQAIAGICIASAPAALYYFRLSRQEFFQSWFKQNTLPTPSLELLLLGLLPLVLLAVVGFFIAYNQKSNSKLLAFLLTWIIIQVGLCYAPVPFQRRFLAGIQFPFAILAGFALVRLRMIFVAILIILASLSNLYISAAQIREIKNTQMPFYIPVPYLKTFDWLEAHTKDETILSGYITGNFLPAYTGLSVYAGHPIQTPDSVRRKQQIVEFFRHPTAGFPLKNKIDLIFYGVEERGFGESSSALEQLFTRIYDAEHLQIYRVDHRLK